MLPAESRMRRSAEFELTVRRGSRARGALLTGHLLVRENGEAQAPLLCREVACLWFGLFHRLRPLARQISPPNWIW